MNNLNPSVRPRADVGSRRVSRILVTRVAAETSCTRIMRLFVTSIVGRLVQNISGLRKPLFGSGNCLRNSELESANLYQSQVTHPPELGLCNTFPSLCRNLYGADKNVADFLSIPKNLERSHFAGVCVPRPPARAGQALQKQVDTSDEREGVRRFYMSNDSVGSIVITLNITRTSYTVVQCLDGTVMSALSRLRSVRCSSFSQVHVCIEKILRLHGVLTWKIVILVWYVKPRARPEALFLNEPPPSARATNGACAEYIAALDLALIEFGTVSPAVRIWDGIAGRVRFLLKLYFFWCINSLIRMYFQQGMRRRDTL
ncbi:hypothetical protein EVAR_29038_1 [Eumeta japonica]|uniref:Uncharacterized protein n=1 Tax=Eumeta variegata TaxID=151549 RepID=A0A4C1W351_EUMVA|nr:hypothetical protein EVAR_29038_1 [Eumeta japonica]